MEQLIEACTDFLVAKKLPAIELGQACSYFMSNPSIVIKIDLDKLLNIFVRATLILRGHAVQ